LPGPCTTPVCCAGVQIALETLRRGEAGALVVAKLDRLSRSMLDFTALMAKATRQSWTLVALDCAVDTTTPAGEAMVNVFATLAQFEWRLIGQRTRKRWPSSAGKKCGSDGPQGCRRRYANAYAQTARNGDH
jgi:DNA invertase Pin-like site-specific DNA recombinase